MGDNSYGARVPWPGPGQPAYTYQQPSVRSGAPLDPCVRHSLDPRFSMQMRPPVMNGYPGVPVSTAMSGSYPMWDMDVPSQMFMQTMNLERLMAERHPNIAQMMNTSVGSEDQAQLNGELTKLLAH